MANSKNIVIIVLVLIIVILVGWTYYTLTVTAPKKAEAVCKASIESEVIPQVKAAAEAVCKASIESEVIPQVKAAAEVECTNLIGQCQQTLQQLMQVPACAAALAQ